MNKSIRISLLLSLIAVLGTLLYWQLKQERYLPKPLGYPRIILPAHEYTPLKGAFPYNFEVSRHAIVTKNTSPNTEPYWINIEYPAFEARIQLTYKPVKNSPQLLRQYFSDAYRLTAKHQVKASAIQEKGLKTPQGHPVILAVLSGEVPSQVQFYTSDRAHHFLRGALYFNTATQNDYLAPVIAFIKKDIIHLIQTLTWKDQQQKH